MSKEKGYETIYGVMVLERENIEIFVCVEDKN